MGASAQSILNGFLAKGIGKACTIAFSPRCGSTVLSNTLSRFGVGLPTEYFQYPYDENVFFSSHDEKDVLSNISELVSNHAPNGIFSSKMTHDHRAYLDDQLRSRLDGILPLHKWIFMRRKDTVAQAVSWYVAETSSQWHLSSASHVIKHQNIEYDFFSILSRLMIIGANNANWDTYFKVAGIFPLDIIYENLVSDPLSEVSAILEYLDIDRPVSDVVLERDGGLKQISKHSSAIYRTLESRFIDDFMKIGQTNDRVRLGPSLDKWNSFFFQSQWRNG